MQKVILKYCALKFCFWLYPIGCGCPHPVILSAVEGSSVAKRKSKIFALRLDVSTGYSQLLCLRIETCGFAFFKGVATWIHTLRNPCKQVAPLCIDRMTRKNYFPICVDRMTNGKKWLSLCYDRTARCISNSPYRHVELAETSSRQAHIFHSDQYAVKFKPILQYPPRRASMQSKSLPSSHIHT